MRRELDQAVFKHAFEIGRSRKSAVANQPEPPQHSRVFARSRPANCPRRLVSLFPSPSRGQALTAPATSPLEGIMVAGHLRSTAGALTAFFLIILLAAPAAAAVQPSASFNSTDAMLKWINGYRRKPDPRRLPVVVRALGEMQAFKDTETSGAYIGFIAGVLGANPGRAESLIAKMLSINPVDHWVLVRAIAYSGLANWRDLLATFVDRMPTRRVMINDYLDGKLPTLDQIAYPKANPGMLDKIEKVFTFGKNRKKTVAIEPNPELIDVLWGYYLATGAYKPIHRIIKLLPLANDRDNVDNLTTGSAAKFTLASNAVRDLSLLAMLKWAVKHEPSETASVLKEVIETAETVDTARMRKESLAAIAELKQKGPDSKRELTSYGEIGAGALSMGCIVAAVTGQVALGLPCVIGGAAYSAGLQYISH
jgi:hypothetical protein